MMRFPDRLVNMVKQHEGIRLSPYKCPAGAWTIGYGHNLDAHPLVDIELEGKPITPEKADEILQEDLERTHEDLKHSLGAQSVLNSARYAALMDMMFQLGRTRFRAFRNMIEAINEGNWDRAAIEMISSKWAKQTPARASHLAYMVKTGKWRE